MVDNHSVIHNYPLMVTRLTDWLARRSALLTGLCAGGFAITLALYALHLGDAVRYPDEADYLQLARHLVTCGNYTMDGATPTAYRPPAYPLFLAGGLGMGLSMTALRIANAATLLACMALLYRLLRPTNPGQARLAVLLVMAYPVLFYTACTFYPQIPATVPLLAAVWLLFGDRPASAHRALLAGICLGAAALMVPALAYVTAFTGLFVWAREWSFRTLRQALLTGCGAALILAPWVLRNAQVFGRFIPLSTNSGVNLILGNSEHTTPNAGTTADISRYEQVARSLSEVAADDYYTREALAYIRAHPWRTAGLYLRKVANHFNYQNRLHTQSESSAARSLVMLASYGFLLGLAILRIAVGRRHPLSPLERYIFWLYVLNAFISAIFFTRVRFRLPMDILLIIPAAAAGMLIINQISLRLRQNSQPGRGIPTR